MPTFEIHYSVVQENFYVKEILADNIEEAEKKFSNLDIFELLDNWDINKEECLIETKLQSIEIIN